jgi:hypothetical protein
LKRRCFFIESLHDVSGEETDVRGGLAEAIGTLVAAEHRGKQSSVVLALENGLPFVVRRDPRAGGLPAVEVGKALRPDTTSAEAIDDLNGQSALEIVQSRMRRHRSRAWNERPVAKLEGPSLPEGPRVQRPLGDDDSQGVPDASETQFHADNYDGYNMRIQRRRRSRGMQERLLD